MEKSLTREQEFSPFFPKSFKDFYSIDEIIDEFTKPCGNFKSPLSFLDKLELAIVKMIANSRILGSMTVVPNYSIPPNWQALLNFLYQKKIISEPMFIARPRPHDFPRFYKAGLSSVFDKTCTDGVDVSTSALGFGTSHQPEEAYAKAVGELLERYVLTLYKQKQFIYTSSNALAHQGNETLDLDNLSTFLPWQKEKFPQFNYTKDSLFHWIQVSELVSGKKTYIPAQLVFWNYKFDSSVPEPFLRDLNTNGQAGHFTFNDSVLSSIYENVERDAFLIYWLNTIAPPLLDMSAVDNPEVQACIGLVERYGLKFYFLDTTTDIDIPSCICVLLDERSGEPYISIGGSAGFNMQKNILSSIREALSAFLLPTSKLPKNYRPFLQKGVGQNERAGLWRGKDMFEKFKFFISGETTALSESRFGKLSQTFKESEQEYKHVLSIFKHRGKGYELYCYEAQHPVLTKLGYYVTRIVIPQLMHMYLNEQNATLDSKRLTEVPLALGHKERALNPWPHPFP